MKKFIKINTVIILLTSMLLVSCFNDLDPQNLGDRVLNSSTVYKTPEDYKKGLAKLYASLAISGQQGPAGQSDISGIDEGFGTFSRALWNAQELPTDEAVIGWDDRTIKDFHRHTWSVNDVFVQALYYRILYTVSICNEFIRVSANNSNEDVQQYAAEARFLRALAYYYGIDMFGNIPLLTEADAPGAFLPKQATRAEIFAYVESELLAIEDELGEPRFEYGRADKAAGWMLLAKLYLNAEVYIDEEKYTECLTQINKVLASSYTLASEYRLNFLADNHTSPEIILPLTFDGTSTQTYGGTSYIINAQLGGSMDKEGVFGSKSAWGGLRTTPEFVGKFSDPSGATDSRAMFYTNGQSLEIDDISPFTEGYAITKWRNMTSTGQLAPHVAYDGTGNTFMDTDFPVFRLAEAHLIYAEAVLRNGVGGSIGQAVDYINDLRERAYGDNSGNITDIQLTVDFILDERARELYWEGHRRTDLIRYGKFTGGDYLWAWKGDVKDGVATASFRDLYPIPASERAANPTLEQNDGY